mmetsp:Transcript_133366/g.386037  ORF Transcript_133366/g.386037 Transcript_133366/m.386037 type:complete len:1013 (+) Transcript_133366:195-3233(+)
MTVRAADNLEVELTSASRDMEECSGIGSSSSEPRDLLDEGQRVQDELERRSNASSAGKRACRHAQGVPSESDAFSDSESVMSIGTTNSIKAVYRSSTATGQPSCYASGGAQDAPAIIDKVEIAIAEAKRAAIERVKDASSASGSGSHSGVGSSSTGTAQSTRLPSVLPHAVLSSLQGEKKVAVEKAVATVVEKTGAELAHMQVALERARESELAMARQKAELQAKLATAQPNAVAKEQLSERLQTVREQKVLVEEERDDLKDKLVGMQTLLDVKLERHIREKETLREQNVELEGELKSKIDSDKAHLKEQLAAAAKDLERAKRNSIAASSERDILMRAENVAKKAHEAELQAIKDEMVAAKAELQKHGIEVMEVLPIVQGELEPEEVSAGVATDAEKILAQRLREQRENNKKLHQDFERLRLEMLDLHIERESELAELKAKVEVQQLLPAAVGRARRLPKPKSAPQGRLSSIDEEQDDDDMASQAGSGVSGQVSSDCDGDGVGDLRDFEGVEEATSKVCDLKHQLARSESVYKNLEEAKKAKEAEYQAKIQRLSEQLQTVRAEAVQNKDWAQKLVVDKNEIEAQKDAEVASVKAKLMSSEIDRATAACDSVKAQDMHHKVVGYMQENARLKDKLVAAAEEKRIMHARLADTRRELEATEERHQRTIDRLRAKLRHFGIDDDPEAHDGAGEDLSVKVWSLEEERNLLRNELEAQQVQWQAQLESEQRQCVAALATLKEERTVAVKDRDLKQKVEDTLAETQRNLKTTRQALADSETKLAASRVEVAASTQLGSSLVGLLRCPLRAREAAAAVPRPMSGGASCQGIVWQIVSSVGGVAALLCSDDGLVIRDASKKAFTMWGSGNLRGASLFKLIFDDGMATWLQSELEAPATPAFASADAASGFWLRDLGFVEFRNRLGSAFDASVVCARLPEETHQGRPPSVVVVVQPAIDEDQRPAQQPQFDSALHGGGGLSQQMRGGGRRSHRHGPGSVASSVQSEDITANDSVSNVNTRW